MIRNLLIALGLMASPAFAEPFSQSGYTLGCDDAGCTVYAAGFLLQVANDGTTPSRIIAQLANMEMLTAVNLKGDLGELGDITAPLTLTGLSVKSGDPYQDSLRALQGEWKPKGEEAVFSVRIKGLQWQAVSAGEVTETYLISPGDACADGTTPGGMTLSLTLMGGDPAESACWQVESAGDDLDLRDLKGDQGQVTFERVSD